ncbi:WYL domain-containing protein [bacterium]|nr:WYL domain-containing protein [bacterium]
MITAEEKTDFCQISLTGMRGLTMLGLLIEAPRSLEEIRNKFLEMKLIDPDNSDDIIRIDMNTLRTMGCEISRSSGKTNYKYVLKKHPFGLEITSEQVNILKRAYKNLKEGASVDLLLKYDLLFSKIAEFVFDEEIKEQLLGVSALKHIDKEKLKELIKDCRHQNTICIQYKDAGNSKTVSKNIVAQKMEFRNDKVYLMGYDIDKNEPVMLPVKRIPSIISRSKTDEEFSNYKPVEVKFFLKNFNSAGIEDCEKIIESHDDISQIIVGQYHNEFVAIQRMLSLGSACIVLEPNDIRQKVIDKLLAMREIYKG